MHYINAPLLHCTCCLFTNLQLHVHASHQSSPVEMVTAFQRFGAVTLMMTVATDQTNFQKTSVVSQGMIQLSPVIKGSTL